MSATVTRHVQRAQASCSGEEFVRAEHAFQNVPRGIQQVALPVYGSEWTRGFGETARLGNDKLWSEESTLRRKTPNGTLNAGYDGALNSPNPYKYQLINANGGPVCRHVQTAHKNAEPTPSQHQQHQQTDLAQRNDCHVTGQLGLQPAYFRSPFAVDSAVKEVPVQHFHGPLYYGQTVPSALQPSFQHLGPTASGVQGSGPYGPYWHDGTFVPYRPAALRDPRFYCHYSTLWSNSLSQIQHAPYGGTSPQVSNPWEHRMLPAQESYPPLVNDSRAFRQDILSHQPSRIYSDSPLPLPPEELSDSPLTQQDLIINSQNVLAEVSPSSPHALQRDKIFAWALQQYRDLLGFVHHTRRQQFHDRRLHGQLRVLKPAFYPKPPRPGLCRSSHSFSATSTQSSARMEVRATPDSILSNDKAQAVTGRPRSIGQDLAAQTAPSTNVWISDSAHHPVDEHNHPGSLGDDAKHDLDLFVVGQDRFVAPDQRVSSTNPYMTSLDPESHSPPARATLALMHMTKLCQDTNWQWIDGMQLGGCLAYGLGDYEKALLWYNKVLEADGKHLEATSNLAATLLALGRRQEAEQHWMKVVKAAPNHFEAVEHLVGLLCNAQRTKDAIRVIEYVERSLRRRKSQDLLKGPDWRSERSGSTTSRSTLVSERSDDIVYDFEAEDDDFKVDWKESPCSNDPGFGTSGFAIPGCDNGRMLSLIHAKGNLLYGLGDNVAAASAFVSAVMIAAGRSFGGIEGLVKHISRSITATTSAAPRLRAVATSHNLDPILLTPEQALTTTRSCFPQLGELPGLQFLPSSSLSIARKASVATTSNSLLSLAKIYQDGMSNSSRSAGITPLTGGVRDILALYYLSLSLQPSPSTANNVGILLAGVQQMAASSPRVQQVNIPGVLPGSGIALALQYYNYGLQLDNRHAHLYTNLGSLLKDIGQLDAAISMYERAVNCDSKFDIALANLANAVKDKGRVSDAIKYYKRAVEVSPDFAEAVCGLANALNSVCGWHSRGGIVENSGDRDRWHVDLNGMLYDARKAGVESAGWIHRVVSIVGKQLCDGSNWGAGVLTAQALDDLAKQVTILEHDMDVVPIRQGHLREEMGKWAGHKSEGAKITRLVERATRRITWHWYNDTYVVKRQRKATSYLRPQLPPALTVPNAPTVLPFHTFTCPMSAEQIRLISQRNALRISVSTLRSAWMPKEVWPPPKPPEPCLRAGYVSSDFNNHPLAHLMQSVFGMHDEQRVKAHCYATTASDNSIHRRQIEKEAPVFRDASTWTSEKLVNQIVEDGIHILVNLNGYTRGARNDVFAARPAPIQMSFMGFAGTLGAEWCDYIFADETAIPPDTLRPWRRNLDLQDQIVDENYDINDSDWVYSENIIYSRDSFFCCDHKQSAPDAHYKRLTWDEEQQRRWKMRKELFPNLSDDTIIFGNFNQLYKVSTILQKNSLFLSTNVLDQIDPTTFRTWLRILSLVPNAILWLLRFPDLGETHLLATARLWAGTEVASRVIFTDVAPKHLHISRARICDLVLDTAECNAHTTAADVLWSGTPLLTLPRYKYKMCSRMAASILKGALPKSQEGKRAAGELVATDENDYEAKAVALGKDLTYAVGDQGRGKGRLVELRKMLFQARWTSALFDTRRWVRDLEDAYEEAWRRWVAGEGGDIWLDRLPRNAWKEVKASE